MPTEDDDAQRTQRTLIEHAKTTPDDLYAVLSLPSPLTTSSPAALTPAILKKAWRSTALKWHPDKNRGHEELAAGKLDTARKAYDVLSEEKAREVFDARQRGAREKRVREEKLEGRRRVMKEELERAERGGAGDGGGGGVKRKMETEEERREREVQRLAAEGARRRNEKVSALRQESEDRAAATAAVKRRREEKGQDAATSSAPSNRSTMAGTNTSTTTTHSTPFTLTTNGTNDTKSTSAFPLPSSTTAPAPATAATPAPITNKLQTTLARLKEAQQKQAKERTTLSAPATDVPIVEAHTAAT